MKKIRNFLFGHPITPFTDDEIQKKGNGFHYKNNEFIHHSSLHHKESAFYRLSRLQIIFILIFAVVLIASFILNWHTTLVVVIAMLTILYFSDLLFNLYLIYRSFSKPAEIKITDEQINSIKEWPRYTILCPLYKEWQVLPQFISAMTRLDYPKDKLQVMLLLEQDDAETISHIKDFNLPKYFDVVIVPHSKPKTKPKACNYGLKFTKGEYIVIYDAEDIPDVLQLKKAVLAFKKTDSRVACIQAKLNFYNPHQNLISKIFTAEYSLWFELVLTGLQSIHAPIPLGGTSNHFKTANLHKLGGWDSFNVTEDCDLGMRLVKHGYRTAIIDSLTLEEANSGIKNWFGQRTRWIKGYMQTYLLHMRRPQDFIRSWKEPHVITFQLIVGGKVMSMFINPLMWGITIVYFLFRSQIGLFIESFFPTPILYMGVLSLLLGNFLYLYYYMVGCAKHGHHELVKYAFLVPFYWLAMSMAAWAALYKLLMNPHYWSKTNHGLHLDNKKATSEAIKKIGTRLIDNTLIRPALTH
ncbi:MAG: glycosyltransferase [Patescibacteria group bacterium]|nr:glycosyltransferase [Patescibacteria group bacterium]